jgi:very-short-patch-repair endonuclease
VLKPEGRRLAAVFACGEGAVLSHVGAAAHWGIRQSAAAVIDVTVPTSAGRRRRPGLRVHRSPRLGPADVTVHEGIPTTTIARTLVDLADVLPPQSLKRTIDEAEYQRLLDMTALLAAVESNPGRRGTRVLGLAIAPLELTRSDLEQRFLKLIERHGFPRPQVNAVIEGYEVDFAWPEHRLIVELDGYASHGRRSAFERDRLRDRRLARAGFRTLRLTDRMVRYGEEAIVADLAAFLSLPRASSNSPSRSSTSAARAV